MNNELGNTTLESLGILTGNNGLVRALTDTEGPDLWLARIDGRLEWLTHSGCAGWGVRSFENLSRKSTQWRRKSEVKRKTSPSEAALVAALRGGKELREFTASGHVASYQVRPMLCSKNPPSRDWQQSASTLEEACSKWFNPSSDFGKGRRWEIIDKPSTSPVDAPGTVITWQEAQRRVDAGLAVETPVTGHELSRDRWFVIQDTNPCEFLSWTYRIPLQPAQPEAVTMTQQALDAAVVELEQVRKQLASALASQKSAEGALEQERMRGEKLRHKTECLVRRITGTGTRDIVRDVVALLNEAEFSESTKAYLQSNETAGKESG